MGSVLANPVRPPELSDERLAQLREHLLGELDRTRRVPAPWLLRTRRRRLLVAVALALAVIYAVTAVAGGKPRAVVYWLYDRSPEKYPLTQVPTVGEWVHAKRAGIDLIQTDKGLAPRVLTVPVMRGEVAGHRFEMQVFMKTESRSKEELHVGFHPGGTPKPYYGTDIPAFDFVQWGLPIHGIREEGGGKLHWVSSGVAIPGPVERSGGGTGPKYLLGAAAATVRQVDLESEDGRVVRVPTFAGPADLPVHVRLWVAALRLDHLVHTIVPRDEQGKALERWHLPFAE